jgi:hypothetical protein
VRVKCATCGGEYDQQLADGMLYFHACAPIAVVLVKRDAGIVAVLPGDVQKTDVVIGDQVIPRPNARNENRVAITDNLGKRTSVAIADGLGVTPAPLGPITIDPAVHAA